MATVMKTICALFLSTLIFENSFAYVLDSYEKKEYEHLVKDLSIHQMGHLWKPVMFVHHENCRCGDGKDVLPIYYGEEYYFTFNGRWFTPQYYHPYCYDSRPDSALYDSRPNAALYCRSPESCLHDFDPISDPDPSLSFFIPDKPN